MVRLAIAVACVLGAGLLRADEAPLSAGALRRHVEYLASEPLEGRGTPRGKQLALEYLRRNFEELGLDPLFENQSWFQEIPGSKSKAGEPTRMGRNIGACLPGSDPKLKDEIIILSAHYDHLGIRGGEIYPGADDNAGSVAMLLEVARSLTQSKTRLRRTVVFLSCDLEEHLLWGSRWFVAHPPFPLEKVKLFITSEMIGRDLGDLPLKTIFVLGTEHGTGLSELVRECSPKDKLQAAPLGIDLIGVRSDYGPFWNEKIPFLFFSGGEHPDYHQPTDLADRLDYERASLVAQMVERICRSAANSDAHPEWIDKPTHSLDEVRTLQRITQLLLDTDDAARAVGKRRLTELQRFTVSNVHSRTRQIIERGALLPDERPWLVRSSQILLLTVF